MNDASVFESVSSSAIALGIFVVMVGTLKWLVSREVKRVDEKFESISRAIEGARISNCSDIKNVLEEFRSLRTQVAANLHDSNEFRLHVSREIAALEARVEPGNTRGSHMRALRVEE